MWLNGSTCACVLCVRGQVGYALCLKASTPALASLVQAMESGALTNHEAWLTDLVLALLLQGALLHTLPTGDGETCYHTAVSLCCSTGVWVCVCYLMACVTGMWACYLTACVTGVWVCYLMARVTGVLPPGLCDWCVGVLVSWRPV